MRISFAGCGRSLGGTCSSGPLFRTLDHRFRFTGHDKRAPPKDVARLANTITVHRHGQFMNWPYVEAFGPHSSKRKLTITPKDRRVLGDTLASQMTAVAL